MINLETIKPGDYVEYKDPTHYKELYGCKCRVISVTLVRHSDGSDAVEAVRVSPMLDEGQTCVSIAVRKPHLEYLEPWEDRCRVGDTYTNGVMTCSIVHVHDKRGKVTQAVLEVVDVSRSDCSALLGSLIIRNWAELSKAYRRV